MRALAALLLLGAAPAPQVAADLLLASDAPRLADYGLFDGEGRPAPGVLPYTLNTPLWSDGAEKARYVWMPPGTQARWQASGALDFPVGTVLIKRFSFAGAAGPQAIETRLLIHRPAGWAALSYVEGPEGAVLKRAGARLAVATRASDGQPIRIDYAVPNQNQCKQCHMAGDAITPLGPTAGNLNDGRQLQAWAASGRLAGAPAAGQWPRLARWDDAALPLDQRARAYLAVNCGHCHNRAGLASNSGLYLNPEEAAPAHIGIFKRPVAAGRGSGGRAFSIHPGRADASILLHRMTTAEPGVMMPQFGRSLVDEAGVALIRQWISAMPDQPEPVPDQAATLR
jgi:uncharacterized repeat protein (TIGR03806 family)